MSTSRRADAERNRALLLEVAREQRDRCGAVPPLADLAALAGVGVGTAYRNFATPRGLVEELADESLQQLLIAGRAALADEDPAALDGFLTRVVRMLAADSSLADVVSRPGDATTGVGEAVAALGDLLAGLLDRARAAGRIRPDLTAADVHHLVCGLQFALRLSDTADRAAADRYTAVLLAGLRP